MEDNNNNTVLACIDASTARHAVCDYASWFAQKAAAPLTFLHTIEHPSAAVTSDYSGAIGLGSRDELLDELTHVEQDRNRLLIEKGQVLLDEADQKAQENGVGSVQCMQRHGSLAESLIDLEDDIRVLVLGIRGEHHDNQEGISTQLESIIRTLHKPILVVNKSFTAPKNIMLAYDGSDACKKALSMIASGPTFLDIPCHVVHVGEQAETLLNEAAATLRAAGIVPITAPLSGKVEEALVEYQATHDIDLMAMGAFSHNRFRGLLLGSFTAKMLKTTRKPLLLLR